MLRRADPGADAGAGEAPIAVGELRIEPDTRRVFVRDEEAALTLREFDLLLFLARHPGRVFSRDQLMDAVWQYSFYSDTSTVTVHIRRLRAKVEIDPGRAAAPADRVGRRLPVPAMSVRRSLLLVLAMSTALAGAVAIGYGLGDGFLVWLGLAALGTVVLGLAHVLAGRRPRRWSLRRQFTVGVAVAVGQLVVLAAVAAQLMFVSAHDALLLMVVVVFAGAIAVRAAQLFATTAIRDVEALRDTLVAVGDGSRTPAAVDGSADELAELTRAVNTAIGKLDDAETARGDLIAAVSHDLRTPITSLRLLAEAVGDDIVDAETRRGYLGQMRTHIDVLSGADRRPLRAVAAGGG